MVTTSSHSNGTGSAVKLRRYPHAYRAMLAICSDLDETPDKETYFELLRFLNTQDKTSLGKGVGLEVANSIYFDMPADQFAYWNTDDAGRQSICRLIRSGHIDIMHSLGDLAIERKQVEQAFEELTNNDCQLSVWVDHAVAPTNFGRDIMQGKGDIPGHVAYHADLAVAHGFRYFWMGRTTSVIGQDRPFSLRDISNKAHLMQSFDTLGREALKHILGRLGHKKYKAHKNNESLFPVTLRDGQQVYEFLRCNPHWGGISSCENAAGVHQVLTPQYLDALLRREGSCILYTHLGKVSHLPPGKVLGKEAVAAFRLLADYSRTKGLLVTTTRKVLDYQRMLKELKFNVQAENNRQVINIQSGLSNDTLAEKEKIFQGLTFEVSENVGFEIALDGMPLKTPALKGTDSSGNTTIGIPWQPLVFPEI